MNICIEKIPSNRPIDSKPLWSIQLRNGTSFIQFDHLGDLYFDEDVVLAVGNKYPELRFQGAVCEFKGFQ